MAKNYSSLVSHVNTSTTNWNVRTQKISRITIHHAAGVGNLDSLDSAIAKRAASWNYGIGNDGSIGVYVTEDHRAWTSSSEDNDQKAVTIEVCNSTGDPTWEISSAAWTSLIALCADICKRNGISKLTYTGKLKGSNLTMHRWFKATACPGPYLAPRFGEICKQVNATISSGKVSATSPKLSNTGSNSVAAASAMLANSTLPSYISITDYLDPSKLHPYIATLSPSVSTFDADKLKSAGVVGLMLYGGSYYDVTHVPRQYYRSDSLKAQAKLADDNNLPYALYVDVRARSVAEAKIECNSLYYVISKYPPGLGLWLKFTFGSNITTNTSILNTYYDYIVKWGLKKKCGIYTTKSQLKNISWSKLQSKYLLWLDDHVKATTEFKNKLLTPEFFDV